MWVLAPPLSSVCPLWGAKPSRICHEGVGVQDLHHFWLYTFVPHRQSNPPTHALYALGACMSGHLVKNLILRMKFSFKYKPGQVSI